MCHRDILSAVDKLLQELMDCSKPFGGKVVLLGGDWRQTPPVAKYVDRDAISTLTIASLPFWKNGEFRNFRLEKNMRARKDAPFAAFCKQVGDGLLPSATPCDPLDPLCSATIDLPATVSAPCGSTNADLLFWVYDGFEVLKPAQWPQFYEARCVLAPTNAAADEMNAIMFVHFHGSLVRSVACTLHPHFSKYYHVQFITFSSAARLECSDRSRERKASSLR